MSGGGEPGAAATVVKLGGSCLEELSAAWWDDLAALARGGPVVLVHGWSRPLRRLHERYRDPSALLRDRYGNQSRWTTPEVLADIAVVSAELGAGVLGRLAERGVRAARLTGSDGLLQAGPGERWWWRGQELVELDNLVGPITGVDPAPLRAAGLAPGRSVLVTPLARDPDGRVVNTDGDRAAAAVAGGARAGALALVTDVPFVLVEGEPVRHFTAKEAADFRDRGATGGMRKKLRAAGEALDRGVPRVIIGNAPVSELLSGGTGTVITRD
ncbi:amino acid kinase family protein [Kitasatospora sp. NPDC054939]